MFLSFGQRRGDWMFGKLKKSKLYLGVIYIARSDVKDVPRFQGRLVYRTSYDTSTYSRLTSSGSLFEFTLFFVAISLTS